MINYPDWVQKHKEKGTVIRKINNKFYKYKVHSERREGKKYPILIQDELLGVITEDGFMLSVKKIINPAEIEVKSLYELLNCDFTKEQVKTLKKIYVIKINNDWYLTKTTEKEKKLIESLNVGEKYGKLIRNI